MPVQAGFIDDFSGALPPGRVVGSASASGAVRKGIDKEGVLSIDNGALRIEPLVKPRWGRSGLAWGPYQRQNGLAFAVSILNGHNTSQTGALPDTLVDRFKQWARGAQTEGKRSRLMKWLRSPQRRYFKKLVLQWVVSGSPLLQAKPLDQNLAVGWFPREAPSSPLDEGNAFVMNAAGPECGELWARVRSGMLRSVRGVQNVQMYYVVVLRERGAAYYAASVSRVPGFSPFPMMTPLAIDPSGADPSVYAGVHQSVLGQIGFRCDTRVYRSQVATLSGYHKWFGSASGADRLVGHGALEQTPAEIGGRWETWSGGFERTANGARAVSADSAAALALAAPAGLVHAVVATDDRPVEAVALLFRVKDRDNFWAFEVGSRQSALVIVERGVVSRFPATTRQRLAPNAPNSVQVSDDGGLIRLNLNGELVYETALTDGRLNDGPGTGFAVAGASAGVTVREFEAHARSIPIPQPLDLGTPWFHEGTRLVASDDFAGQPSDLAGRTTSVGAKTWRRSVGSGQIQLTGDGIARVRATVQEPCPERTAYTIPWDDPTFSDISVIITPPGTEKGNRERGRGGIIFQQDDRNYITLSIFVDDWYGMSIAAFFYRDGYEELYDAVWTNIGRRVHWGMPYGFRAVFDGERFTAFVNDEPVIHRALTDIYPDWKQLAIKEAGIVANWEWGNDTGSTFRDFVAKGR